MAVWVVRILDDEDPPPVLRSRFGDVHADSFHGPFIERMAELEVTSGCGDGADFCPHRSVTRAEMAVFLSSAYNLADGPDLGFADVGADTWYAADVARLAWSGITTGCGDGTVFCPDRPTTRAQTAAFLWRAETRFGRGSDEADPRPSSVSLSVGSSARGVVDEEGDGCRSVHCRWLRIDAQTLAPGPYAVECWHEAFRDFPRAAFEADTVPGLPTEDVCFFGFPDVRVWAVVDGVKSNEVMWPHGRSAPDPPQDDPDPPQDVPVGDMSKGRARWLREDCRLQIPESLEAWRKRCLEIWAAHNPPDEQLYDPFDLYKGPSDYENLESIHSVLKYPDVRAEHFNGKKSYAFYPARYRGETIRESWNGGSHSYACGVKDSFSTYAAYDFEDSVKSSGRYMVYAYYPGDTESPKLRNDGHGVFSIFVNEQRRHGYLQHDQYGGWRPVKMSEDDYSIWLGQGSRIRINIDNGLHDEEGEENSCANGTRVVFPPLLLVNSSRYNLKDFRPFDPVRDANPITLSLFATCMSIPTRPGSTLDRKLGRDYLIIKLVESIIVAIPRYGISLYHPVPGVPGSIGFDLGSSMDALDDWNRAVRLAIRCVDGQYSSSYICKIPITLYWLEPSTAMTGLDGSASDDSFARGIRDPLHPLGTSTQSAAGYEYTYNGRRHAFGLGHRVGDCDERPLLDQDAHDIFRDENGIMWVRSVWATATCKMDDGQDGPRIEAPHRLLGRYCID